MVEKSFSDGALGNVVAVLGDEAVERGRPFRVGLHRIFFRGGIMNFEVLSREEIRGRFVAVVVIDGHRELEQLGRSCTGGNGQ